MRFHRVNGISMPGLGDRLWTLNDSPRVLIIRPSALGDVCRSVPIAAALREHWPDAKIHWLVNAPWTDVLIAHPAIDRVIPFDRRGLGSSLKRLNPGPTLRLFKELRENRYDMVIEAQGLARSAIFARATGARQRIGYADAREFGWLALTDRVRLPKSIHTVTKMMGLLGPLGIRTEPDLRLYSPEYATEQISADAELSEPYLVLAPTSIWPGKRWPIGRFTELARRLTDVQHRVVVVGAPGERPQCRELLDLAAEGRPIIDRVGRTSIGQLMALIERSQLVLANDSAALHMAVGLGTPIVALFGPTDCARVGPFGHDEDVIQHVSPGDVLNHKDRAAGSELMQRITVDEVEQAIVHRLR